MNKYRKLPDAIVLATHNRGKIEEITSFLTPLNIRITTAASLGLIEPVEYGTTYLENALIKARAATIATGMPALSDDSGIEVDALDGLPGVNTAPYTHEHGGREKVFHLWQNLPQIIKNPSARFMCVQVLFWPDGYYDVFEGMVNGFLSFPARGNSGHGYDPVLIPAGYDKTVAEIKDKEKHFRSHRIIALEKLTPQFR